MVDNEQRGKILLSLSPPATSVGAKSLLLIRVIDNFYFAGYYLEL